MSKQQGQSPDIEEIPKKGLKKHKVKYEWEMWEKRIKGSPWDYIFFKKGKEEPEWSRHSKYRTERDVDQALDAIRKNRWWNKYSIYEKRKIE